MNELLQQIFSLEDPIGKEIVNWIRIFFWIGVVNYGLHFLRLVYEGLCLYFVKKNIKSHGLSEISSDFLNNSNQSIIFQHAIGFSSIHRRIQDLVSIKQNGGEIDHDVLGDIHAGAASRKAGLSRYILGILIILGLVGTLWGLTTAVIEVQPLLEDIDDLDQLPQISEALQKTLTGMGTAFKTTLAGLLASFGLGFIGWSFNLSNSVFLTQFEKTVAIEIIPCFTQTPETAVVSSMDGLKTTVDEFKMATETNVSKMQESIQQLTEKSWDTYLEQQYVITQELSEIPIELRESLGGINEYQVLIKTTVEQSDATTKQFIEKISEFQSTVDTMANDFREMTERSIAQVAEYQSAVLTGIEKVVSDFRQESAGLKATIQDARESQSRFVDELANNLSDTLADTLETQLQSMLQPIMENQQVMVVGLTETVDNLRAVAGELQIRSALENQNEVFENIRSDLTQNQQLIANRLSQLISELQVQPALEAQNKVFERIEGHFEGQREMIGEQNEIMQTLDSSVKQLQQTFLKTESGDQQHTEQIKRELQNNFITLGEKIDALNRTISKPGLYRWGSEIRRWLGIFRK
ncbi:MAG: hypothetical protein OXI67_13110 [Candidatus Poribacteria bacterium]|nr:hypothetical protein [Candidatus Poribacteria bacterium]